MVTFKSVGFAAILIVLALTAYELVTWTLTLRQMFSNS